MGLPYVGPVSTRVRQPDFRWTSAPDAHGARACVVSGVVQWSQAQQLVELVDNPDRSVTVGAQSGVLEPLVFDDDLLRLMTGWYLLQSFDLNAAWQWSGHGIDYPVGFSLKAAVLGAEVEPVVIRSGRRRANDFGLTPVTLAADPWWTPSALAESQAPNSSDPRGVLPPGTRTMTREYDRRAWSLNGEAASSFRVLYLADLGVGVQDRNTIVPGTRRNDGPVPSWTRYRGGDVRAYDRSDSREVYGPGHPFRSTTDLAVTNGHIRFWVGARGMLPYLHVQAWKSGVWNEMGTVVLGAPGVSGSVLQGARLVRCTPDSATVALLVNDLGDVFVTLRRGERMLRLAHGAGRPPLVAGTRRVGWQGMPPGTATNVTTGTGRFGNGVALDTTSTLLFDWPRTVQVERWCVAGFRVPAAASSAQPDGLWCSILNGSGAAIGSLTWDATNHRLVFALGSNSIVLSVSWTAGQAIGYVLRFSVEQGMALTVNVNGGAASHVANPAFTNPGITDAFWTSLAFTGAGVTPPVGSTRRVTEAGDYRITESGFYRVTEV